MGKEWLSAASLSMNKPYTDLGTTENQTVLGGELIPNLTIDVKGTNKAGHPYSRTIIRSVYVEK